MKKNLYWGVGALALLFTIFIMVRCGSEDSDKASGVVQSGGNDTGDTNDTNDTNDTTVAEDTTGATDASGVAAATTQKLTLGRFPQGLLSSLQTTNLTGLGFDYQSCSNEPDEDSCIDPGFDCLLKGLLSFQAASFCALSMVGSLSQSLFGCDEDSVGCNIAVLPGSLVGGTGTVVDTISGGGGIPSIAKTITHPGGSDEHYTIEFYYPHSGGGYFKGMEWGLSVYDLANSYGKLKVKLWREAYSGDSSGASYNEFSVEKSATSHRFVSRLLGFNQEDTTSPNRIQASLDLSQEGKALLTAGAIRGELAEDSGDSGSIPPFSKKEELGQVYNVVSSTSSAYAVMHFGAVQKPNYSDSDIFANHSLQNIMENRLVEGVKASSFGFDCDNAGAFYCEGGTPANLCAVPDETILGCHNYLCDEPGATFQEYCANLNLKSSHKLTYHNNQEKVGDGHTPPSNVGDFTALKTALDGMSAMDLTEFSAMSVPSLPEPVASVE